MSMLDNVPAGDIEALIDNIYDELVDMALLEERVEDYGVLIDRDDLIKLSNLYFKIRGKSARDKLVTLLEYYVSVKTLKDPKER